MLGQTFREEAKGKTGSQRRSQKSKSRDKRKADQPADVKAETLSA